MSVGRGSSGAAITVAFARTSLQSARDDLDDAVRELPDLADDNMMATPALLALVLRVVTAKRQLSGLELTLVAHDAPYRPDPFL